MRWTLLVSFVVTVPAFVAAVAWWSRRHDAGPAVPAAPRDDDAPRVAAPDRAYAAAPHRGESARR